MGTKIMLTIQKLQIYRNYGPDITSMEAAKGIKKPNSLSPHI